MADDEGGKSLDDKLDELKRKAAVVAARRSIEKTGHGLLDGLERWLFGKVGGAEEVLRKETNRGSALDRLRTEIEHAEAEEELTPEAPAPGPTPAQKARERKREAALAQLEAIKQRLAEEDGGAPEEAAAAGEGTPAGRTLDPPPDDAPPAEPRRKKTPRSL